MEQMKRKLIMAGLSLTLAVVLMVTASMAWMTLSVKPEISGMQVTLYTDRTLLSADEEAGEFVQYLNISDQFLNLAPLRPTSTVDGINWFIPTYNEVVNPKDDDQSDDGALNAASDFKLATAANANVSLLDGNGQLLTGDALRDAISRSHYVYADFWLKTEEADGCRVRLSVPESKETLQSGETQNGVYGSYVLAGREYMEVNGQDAKRLTAKEAESCVRVGFLIDPDGESDTYGTEFYIYEPNADQRSKDTKPTHTYVHGYTFDEGSYKDQNYIKTDPIGVNASTGKGEVQRLNTDRLIVQKTSEWNQTSAAEKIQTDKPLNSNDVNKMGRFLTDDDVSAAYAAGGTVIPTADSAGEIASKVILTLKQEDPVKVRLFIWLEGQDVDCWNDIAAGSFVVNLELAGESIVPTDTE